jgi:hypothetical protein
VFLVAMFKFCLDFALVVFRLHNGLFWWQGK